MQTMETLIAALTVMIRHISLEDSNVLLKMVFLLGPTGQLQCHKCFHIEFILENHGAGERCQSLPTLPRSCGYIGALPLVPTYPIPTKVMWFLCSSQEGHAPRSETLGV